MAKMAAPAKTSPKKTPAKKVVAKAAPKASAVQDKPVVARYHHPVLPVDAPENLRPAGGWLRLLARMIDGIIIFFMSLIVGFAFGVVAGIAIGIFDPELVTKLNDKGYFEIFGNILGIILSIFYYTWMHHKYYATFGKKFMRIVVIDVASHQSISLKQSLGRSLAEFLNIFTLYIGYFIVFFRKDKRGLHDFISSTQVVKSAIPLPNWHVWIASVGLVLICFVPILAVAGYMIYSKQQAEMVNDVSSVEMPAVEKLAPTLPKSHYEVGFETGFLDGKTVSSTWGTSLQDYEDEALQQEYRKGYVQGFRGGCVEAQFTGCENVITAGLARWANEDHQKQEELIQQKDSTRTGSQIIDAKQKAYGRGYDSGYVDGYKTERGLGDGFVEPEVAVEKPEYMKGYLVGFRTGCDEAGVTNCEEIIEKFFKNVSSASEQADTPTSF